MKYQTISFLFMMSLFMASCEDKGISLTIPDDVMRKVLADVHMAEGAILNVRYENKDSMREVYYSQIYEIHGISEEAFRSDMEYYQDRPEELEDLYELVIKDLVELDTRLKKDNTETKKK